MNMFWTKVCLSGLSYWSTISFRTVGCFHYSIRVYIIIETYTLSLQNSYQCFYKSKYTYMVFQKIYKFTIPNKSMETTHNLAMFICKMFIVSENQQNNYCNHIFDYLGTIRGLQCEQSTPTNYQHRNKITTAAFRPMSTLKVYLIQNVLINIY